MERSTWLAEKRRTAETRYTTLFADTYDEEWGHISATHHDMLVRFLAMCPPKSTILDAACGTGKYWPLMLERSFAIVGIDQSQGMLDQAHVKYPDVTIQKMGLQEMTFQDTFSASMCIDAMEFVAPEEWPLILANFHRALQPHGMVYFTVEIANPAEIQAAFEAAQQMGLPVVYGEWGHEAGYHYYPDMDRVQQWMDEAGFVVLDESEGDYYRHVIARRQ